MINTNDGDEDDDNYNNKKNNEPEFTTIYTN